MNKYFLLVAYASLFSLGLIDNSRGPIYPLLINDFSVSNNIGALFFSLASLSGLLVYISARYWSPLISSLNLMRISLMIMAFSGTMLALCIGNKLSFILVLICSFLLGLGFSGSAISENILCAEGSSPKYLRRALSGLHSTYGLSSLVAPLIFNFFLVMNIHYFWYIGLVACFSWATLLYSFIGEKFNKKSKIILNIVSDSLTEKRKRKRKRKKLGPPCSIKKRFFMGGHLAFYVAGEILISSRLVSYLLTKNLSLEISNIYLSLFFTALMLGRVIFAIFHPKWENWKMLFCSNFLTLIFFFIAFKFHPLGFVLSGLSMSYYFPYSMDVLLITFPNDKDFMTVSTMSFVSIMLILMNIGIGYLSTLFGMGQAFILAPILIFVSLMFLTVNYFLLYKVPAN